LVANECTAIDDALRLLAHHKESDALLDVLHLYSEELFDSDVEQQPIGLQTIDSMDCQSLDDDESQSSPLGSIKDLMAFDDHLYYKSSQLTTDSIDFNDSNFDNNCIPMPLSPLSCDSDSGYESLPSPIDSLDLDHKMIGSPDVTDVSLDHTFTQLFPDLI